MKKLHIVLGATALAAALLAGCGGGDKGGGSAGGAGSGASAGGTAGGTAGAPVDRPRGQSSFDQPVGGNGNSRGENGDTAGPSSGAAGGGAPPAPGGDTSNPERLIEEGDIVKLDGTTMYVLNRYRGLQVIDLANPASPALVGSAQFYGYPLELYVRGQRAYVIVSDYWSWWRCDDCDTGFDNFHGSKVHVVDLTNARAPMLAGSIDVEGEITDSRLVGDILYVVSNEHSGYSAPRGTSAVQDQTFVASIDVSDPRSVRQVARENFPRNGWENHINATSSAIFVASSAYGYWDGQGECPAQNPSWGSNPCTQLTHIDITDPRGQITVRGRTIIEGYIHDRWAMDYDVANEVLRVIAAPRAWGGSIEGPVLRTLRARDGQLTAIGRLQLQLPRPEALMAARFEGSRAYVVTFERRDPLFVVDLSDAANPAVTAQLDTPGWLDHIEPRGDRLVALGHDQDPTTQRWVLQVSLYDVADLRAPRLLDREPFGSDWGWVPGSRDDFQKVFKVIDELGLVLVPHQRYEEDTQRPWWGRSVGAVQLLDFDRTSLTLRGLVKQNGYTERALVLPEHKLVALSSEVLDVLDITDRSHPTLTGSLELARNVQDIAVAGDVAVEFVGTFQQRNTKLYVVPASDPNTTTPMATIDFPRPWGRMFRNGTVSADGRTRQEFAYVMSDATYTGRALPNGESEMLPATLSVVDLSQPTAPRLRGSIELGELGYGGGCWAEGDAVGPGFWGGGCGGAETVQVDGSLVAIHKSGYCKRWDPMGSTCAEQVPNEIDVVDLSNPDAPVIASQTRFDEADWMYGMKAEGRTLYVTHYESFQVGQSWRARYYLDRLDLSNPAAPEVLRKINVPGELLGTSADGSVLYTTEHWYDYDAQTGIGSSRLFVHALDLDRQAGVAYLRDTVALFGDASRVALAGSHAYAVVQHYDPQTGRSTAELASLDLGNPDDLRVSLRRVDGGGRYWWGDVTIAGSRMFLANGDGLAIYSLEDPMAPRFETFHRTRGYWYGGTSLVVDGDRAFLPSGYQGVQVVSLR